MRLALLLAGPAAAAGVILLASPAATGTPRADGAGQRAYLKCYSCHALEPGKNDLTGPTLHRIVGRRIAAEAGFAYSPELRAFAARHPRWTKALLDRLIRDPEQLVPGTTMQFHGISDPAERALLLDYLATARNP